MNHGFVTNSWVDGNLVHSTTTLINTSFSLPVSYMLCKLVRNNVIMWQTRHHCEASLLLHNFFTFSIWHQNQGSGGILVILSCILQKLGSKLIKITEYPSISNMKAASCVNQQITCTAWSNNTCPLQIISWVGVWCKNKFQIWWDLWSVKFTEKQPQLICHFERVRKAWAYAGVWLPHENVILGV